VGLHIEKRVFADIHVHCHALLSVRRCGELNPEFPKQCRDSLYFTARMKHFGITNSLHILVMVLEGQLYLILQY
jgi:hypothetical protein